MNSLYHFLNQSTIESLLGVCFKRLYDKGLIYKGYTTRELHSPPTTQGRVLLLRSDTITGLLHKDIQRATLYTEITPHDMSLH